jgi:hypothetical protein
MEVCLLHPAERFLGRFNLGYELPVEVPPFRSCLLLVDAKQTGGVGLRGCDCVVVRDDAGRDVVIRLLGRAGKSCPIDLVSGGRKFKRATIDGQPAPDLVAGRQVNLTFSGSRDGAPWHRLLGSPRVFPVATLPAVPADAEVLFESSGFAGDNDPLVIRLLRRSGPSQIPAVQKARQAFLDQPIIAQEGMLTEYLFDGKPDTSCNLLRGRSREPQNRLLGIDLGEARRLDESALELPPTGEIRFATVTPTNRADVSADLKTWWLARFLQVGRNIRIECDTSQPVRYLRTDLVPEKVSEIRGYTPGKELARDGWRASWLFSRFKEVRKAWTLSE